MPIADPEERREYMRKYQKARREELALRRRELRQKNIAYERKRAEEKNRAKGHAPRPQGTRRRTRIAVDATRRWVIFEDRCYTNSQIGFTAADLKEMQSKLVEHIATQVKKNGK